MKQMASQITHLPIENQEDIHIVKYLVGGEYKPHHDAFHIGTSYYDGVMKSGGQRKYSCLFYLNDDFEGGETEFPEKRLKITPKVGRLLAWCNANEDSTVKQDSLHAGLPVTKGEKWIAIIWVRESAFR
jgi:prolyl 4-hydroxylase